MRHLARIIIVRPSTVIVHRPVTYWTEATHTEVTQFFLEIHHLIHNAVEVAILQHDMQYYHSQYDS